MIMNKTVFVQSYGGPEVLYIESSQISQPKSDELLIEVHYAGVLALDWKIRSGLAKEFFPVEFPYIPGQAMSGVVTQVGQFLE
jgi:NADPH:quinone reductase-like Zn-dependent oxidoreductase